jgi:type II secretory pathway pseudopilin PulG
MDTQSRGAVLQESGFTLLELLISMALMFVIFGTAVGGLNYFQKQYRSANMTKTLQQQMRAAVAEMSQDIGQAGLANSGMVYRLELPANSTTTTQSNTEYLLNAAVAANASTMQLKLPPNSTLSSPTTGLSPYQRLLVDTGGTTAPGLQDIVTVGSVNTSTNTVTLNIIDGEPGFTYAHAAGAAVIPFGVYPEGIVYPDGTQGASSVTSLRLFGDLEGDGLLKFVIYQCPAQGRVGAFTRDVYDLASSTLLDHVTLLDYVDNTVDSSGNYSGCQFIYSPVPTGNSNTIAAVKLADVSNARFVLGVSVSLRARSSAVDPQTGSYLWESRSFLNIQPRNIRNAYNRAVASQSTATANDLYQLQVKPYSATGTAYLPLFTQAEIPN